MDEFTEVRFKKEVAELKRSILSGDDVADPMASLMEIAERFGIETPDAITTFLNLEEGKQSSRVR